jgi:hypothetical protein
MTEEDYEYFRNKRADRVYLSRALSQKAFRRAADGAQEEFVRPFRIVSKVIDGVESHEFFRDGKQISLRITDGQRQEIKAKFYEDNRDVATLQIQRYTVEGGAPHKTYFTFVGPEIATLYNFLRNIQFLPIQDEHSARPLDDKFVESIVLTKEQAVLLVSQQPQLFEELTRHQITAQDVAILGHRRSQLTEFEKLLNSDELSGAIAQVQRSVQTSLTNIRSRTDIKDSSGAPTGERVFLYRPRSVIVLGSLLEFQSEHGINEDKYSSFELFRRHLSAPEIITFDELFERAKFIVESHVAQE